MKKNRSHCILPRGQKCPRTGDNFQMSCEGCEYKKIIESTSQEIIDEMDKDLEDSGVAQGEIVSCLNHWKNKYLITRK